MIRIGGKTKKHKRDHLQLKLDPKSTISNKKNRKTNLGTYSANVTGDGKNYRPAYWARIDI